MSLILNQICSHNLENWEQSHKMMMTTKRRRVIGAVIVTKDYVLATPINALHGSLIFYFHTDPMRQILSSPLLQLGKLSHKEV